MDGSGGMVKVSGQLEPEDCLVQPYHFIDQNMGAQMGV